jgi:hypothetical protein
MWSGGEDGRVANYCMNPGICNFNLALCFTGKCFKIFLSPLYHATQRVAVVKETRFQQDFKVKMVAKLAELKSNVQNFMFMNYLRNVVILDPAFDLKQLAEADVWGDGPHAP